VNTKTYLIEHLEPGSRPALIPFLFAMAHSQKIFVFVTTFCLKKHRAQSYSILNRQIPQYRSVPPGRAELCRAWSPPAKPCFLRGRHSPNAPALDKVLRIARTIADLDRAADIAAHHLAEANCARGILANAFWNRAGKAA